MSNDVFIEVDVKALRRALREAEKDVKEIRAANKSAGEVIEQDSRSHTVPKLTRKLMRSIRNAPTTKLARVRAGGARAPYAGVVHYGDPNRGHEANEFFHESASRKWQKVRAAYVKYVEEIGKKISS